MYVCSSFPTLPTFWSDPEHFIVLKEKRKKKNEEKPEAHGPQCSPECIAMKAMFSQNTVNVACKKN